MNEVVSVVTVNFNNAEGLLDTIQSVLSQDYQKIEFIVVDGGSTDGSNKVIEKYKKFIDVTIIESDNGVYDAMNKGIKSSTGTWINFMNSGDVFCNDLVVTNVMSNKISVDTKVIYGSQRKNGQELKPLPVFFLELGMIHACHQAMFFYKDICYDLSYTIYSDFDLVARIYKNSPDALMCINEVICEFEGGGISSVASKEKRLDKYRSVYNNFGLKCVVASFLYMLSAKLRRSK